MSDLEQRLQGLENLKEPLLEALDKDRINFADRSNWSLLPKTRGGQSLSNAPRSWKYAWSDKLINYFDEIGASFDSSFKRGLYGKLNKDVMKKPVYGVISYPNVPADIYQRLTDWEKLCFVAGTYKKGGIRSLEDKPFDEIVKDIIKTGMDYLHATHAVKKAMGAYETILKVPGSQHYRKKAQAAKKLSKDEQLAQEFSTLLQKENTDPSYDNQERAGIFLDGCTEKQKAFLQKKFGADTLGGYAKQEQLNLFDN